RDLRERRHAPEHHERPEGAGDARADERGPERPRAAERDEERGFYAAAVRALGVARAPPAGAVWACAWRASLGLAAIAGAGWAAGALGVSTGGRVALAFVVHHAGLAAAAFLRASWLAAAIRLLDRTAPER
ncbi:MAG: hypothetical protein IT372_16820, partial [Polyangiaceae bacterium]|nr:hypothetical protein [Polyangiaceae bacterium]